MVPFSQMVQKWGVETSQLMCECVRTHLHRNICPVNGHVRLDRLFVVSVWHLQTSHKKVCAMTKLSAYVFFLCCFAWECVPAAYCVMCSKGAYLISISTSLVNRLGTHGHMSSRCPPGTFIRAYLGHQVPANTVTPNPLFPIKVD